MLNFIGQKIGILFYVRNKILIPSHYWLWFYLIFIYIEIRILVILNVRGRNDFGLSVLILLLSIIYYFIVFIYDVLYQERLVMLNEHSNHVLLFQSSFLLLNLLYFIQYSRLSLSSQS
jgi:hypothetical protein